MPFLRKEPKIVSQPSPAGETCMIVARSSAQMESGRQTLTPLPPVPGVMWLPSPAAPSPAQMSVEGEKGSTWWRCRIRAAMRRCRWVRARKEGIWNCAGLSRQVTVALLQQTYDAACSQKDQYEWLHSTMSPKADLPASKLFYNKNSSSWID